MFYLRDRSTEGKGRFILKGQPVLVLKISYIKRARVNTSLSEYPLDFDLRVLLD